MRGVVGGFDMGDSYSIIEAKLPGMTGGSLLDKGEVFKKTEVRIVTIKRVVKTLVRKVVKKIEDGERRETLGVPKLDEVFQEDDIFVLFGREKKLRSFLEEYAK